jgi:hypothetical protein
MDFQSNKRFELQIFLNIRILTLNAEDVSSSIFSACMQRIERLHLSKELIRLINREGITCVGKMSLSLLISMPLAFFLKAYYNKNKPASKPPH